MNKSLTVKRSFYVRKGTKSKRQIREGEKVPEEMPGISRLIALAIHFDELICAGVVKDQSGDCEAGAGESGTCDTNHEAV